MKYVLIAILAFVPAAALCAEETGTLTVNVTGAVDDKGQVIAALFPDRTDFPFNDKKAYRLSTANLSGGNAQVVFKDIPYGTYAVMAAHDADYSNSMNMKGPHPDEGYGVSNNYDAEIAGITFDASAFSFKTQSMAVNIRSAQGNILAGLFAVKTGFPFETEKAALRTYGVIKNGQADFIIDDVPYGEYALIMIHDENVNGKLDMLRNGIPVEGYGSSGNHIFNYTPPTFRMSSFRLKKRVMELAVKMNYDFAFGNINFPVDRDGSKRGDITVRVNNIKTGENWIMAALFPSKKGFPGDREEASMLTYAWAENGNAVITFPGVPLGEYAISVFSDGNNNGKFDKNILGIPREQYGASNNNLRNYGPPRYKDSNFNLQSDKLELSITLK